MDGFIEFEFTKPQYGVYALYSVRELVYVGKSCYVYDRVIQHYRARRFHFDRCLVKRCETIQEMNGLEYTMISRHKPRYNQRDRGYSDIVATVDVAQFLPKRIGDYRP